MSYLVLARKYRPNNFDEVVGQEHITELLKKVVISNRLAHAYLFCGPRGIGKTSCARILSKSLNCKEGPTVTPCGKCPACEEITRGTSFDVLEIDGASNRGIDEIRTLRENVKFAPGYGRYKIYIIDEVHMLTTEAFNALLKTLEEPPEHVKFIFATTDPNKVPATIISRCQRYDFKRILLKTGVEALEKICEAEGFKVDQDALYAISKAAQGSFRDALSILDQISVLNDGEIKSSDVYAMLGLVEVEMLFQLADALGAKDCLSALKTFDAIIEKGKDIKQLSRDLIEHFRNLMVIKIGGKSLGRMIDYPVVIKEMYLTQSEKFALTDILNAIDLFVHAQDVARVTESLRMPIEVAFAKMTYQGEGAVPEQSASEIPQKKVEANQEASARRFSPGDILKNKKGQVNASDDDVVEESQALPELQDIALEDPVLQQEGVPVDIEKIRQAWDALTYAVSRKKMSVATYLQESRPISFKEEKLVIGFTKEHEFFKETLEQQENVMFVGQIFSEKLKAKVLIEYVFVDDEEGRQHEQEIEPFVQEALDTFEGKIVNQWHKE